jgi:hypothetical protein
MNKEIEMGAIEREPSTAVAVTNDVAAVMQVIERAASNPDVSVEKLEKLLDIQERIFSKNAEIAFNGAMAEMQAELPVITEKGSIIVDQKLRSRYAKFEDINEAVKPILMKHGFAISFRIDSTNGKVNVTGILTHRGGHREQTSMELPVDTSGSKNPVQAVGSSTAYGKRYVMEALLNLTSRGQDDDGKRGGGSAVSEERFQALKKQIEATTSKDAAKKLWSVGVKECEKAGDLATAERLKEVLIAHGKFIDEAAKAK